MDEEFNKFETVPGTEKTFTIFASAKICEVAFACEALDSYEFEDTFLYDVSIDFLNGKGIRF